MNEDSPRQIIATASGWRAPPKMVEAVGRLDAQQQALNAQVNRIVAAVEENETESRRQLGARLAELERTNAKLKAETTRHAAGAQDAAAAGDRAAHRNRHRGPGEDRYGHARQGPALLAVDQRIAVKAQMASAGSIE